MWIYLTQTVLYVKTKFIKFRKLVNGYRDQGHSLCSSVFHAFRLVYRQRQYDHYSEISSVRHNNTVFVKVIVGGSPQIVTIRVKNGPKPVLEYAFFDNKRNDKLFLLLSGPNRDFNDSPEVLFLFGNEIRYKFMNRHEIAMKSENQNHTTESSRELEKKILSICHAYD
jgi:hypothetical protein